MAADRRKRIWSNYRATSSFLIVVCFAVALMTVTGAGAGVAADDPQKIVHVDRDTCMQLDKEACAVALYQDLPREAQKKVRREIQIPGVESGEVQQRRNRERKPSGGVQRGGTTEGSSGATGGDSSASAPPHESSPSDEPPVASDPPDLPDQPDLTIPEAPGLGDPPVEPPDLPVPPIPQIPPVPLPIEPPPIELPNGLPQVVVPQVLCLIEPCLEN